MPIIVLFHLPIGLTLDSPGKIAPWLLMFRNRWSWRFPLFPSNELNMIGCFSHVSFLWYYRVYLHVTRLSSFGSIFASLYMSMTFPFFPDVWDEINRRFALYHSCVDLWKKDSGKWANRVVPGAVEQFFLFQCITGFIAIDVDLFSVYL